jgi:hypothetical protein
LPCLIGGRLDSEEEDEDGLRWSQAGSSVDG